jgi:glycosyltransferase involved in cell wall biosynthesis
VAVAPALPPGRREPVVAAYAANPDKRGLDLLCRAWALVGAPDARLVVCGIERERAERFLERRGAPLPAGVELPGSLPRDQWLDLLGRAAAMASASYYEDWGLAPMEALSAGTPLATVASGGPYEALAPARRLAPGLVAERREPEALAAAIEAALGMDEAGRERYAEGARGALAPYRPAELERVVAEEVLPRMLA